MNRIVKFIVLMALAIVALTVTASLAGAQTMEQRLAALEAKVALQDSIIGSRKFMTAQVPCELLEANRPVTWFPNGEYDLAFRNRQFGCAFDPLATVTYGLQASFTGWAARLAAVEVAQSYSSTPTSGASYSDLISYGTGELMFIGRDNGGTRQSGVRGDFKTLFGINNYDGGARILQNWNHNGTKQRPYATVGMDSEGDFSYNWFPAENPLWPHPDAAPASVHSDPSHPLYAPYRGQALVISGSQVGYGYLTGQQLWQTRNVMTAAQRAGQSLFFAVSPTRTSVGTPTNRVLMKLEADPNYTPNPVHVVIDGELRRLKSCNVGGVTVVCFDE